MTSNQYYTVNEMYGEKFYQIPKVLFTNDLYRKGLSAMEKLAFGLLKDRFRLSVDNKWFDDEGRIYFIYSRVALAEIFDCSLPTATNIKNSLVRVGLLEENKRGQGKTSLYYLKKPIVTEDDIYKIDKAETLDTHERLKNLPSRSKEICPLEDKNITPNDTDLSKTDLKEFDDDDLEKPKISESPINIQPVKNLLQSQKLSTITINNIIAEMKLQGVHSFTITDITTQLTHMGMEASIHGVHYNDFAKYFVNGVRFRNEQTQLKDTASKQLKKKQASKINNDKETYYNWLEEMEEGVNNE